MPTSLRRRAALPVAALAACFAAATGFARDPELRLETRLGNVSHPAGPAPRPTSAPLHLRPAQALGARGGEPLEGPLVALIATVRVNELDKGEHALYVAGEDELFMPSALLAQWLPALALPGARAIEGEAHVRLRDIAGARVRFDVERLAVDLAVSPAAFAPQTLRYQASDRPAPTPLDAPSAIVNYQVGASGPTRGGGEEILSAALEAVVRRREWVARSALFQSHSRTDATTGRGATFVAREDPYALTRLTFGDFLTAATELAGGVPLAGISFARALDLDPYTVRTPGAAHRELIDVPSTIDVYVGDNRIIRQAVGPGPVDIANLTYLAGRRDVRIVVRDAFGRERETTFPFYFSDRGLAAGVHDYNYGIGAVRRDLNGARGRYAGLALAAFHRAGLNDVVTASAQLEATRETVVAGPAVTLRMDTLGIVSLAALASHDRTAGRGAAAALGYTFVGGRWSGGGFVRAATRGFTTIARPEGSAAPARLDAAASLSWASPGWGTFTATLGERRMHDGEAARTASLGYAYSITRSWQVQALWRRTDGPQPLREAFVSLQYSDREHLGRATLRRDNDRRAARLQVGNFTPVGEGLGYTVTGEVSDSPRGRQTSVTPEFVWNMPFATLQGNLLQTRGADSGGFGAYQLALNGSIAIVGRHAGFSRAIEDSFAIARVVPGVDGVRVYLNEQPMGRTGSDGRIFLPRLVSSINNAVSIDDRDLPIERSLDRRLHMVVPWPRSGVLVDFEAPLRRSVATVVRVRRGGEWIPVGRAVVRIDTPAGRVEVPTGIGGELYLENLAPGDYPSMLESELGGCAFTLRIPDSTESQLRIDDVDACTPS